MRSPEADIDPQHRKRPPRRWPRAPARLYRSPKASSGHVDVGAHLLTFAHWPGRVEPTNNACERDLRPAVIQRKITNGYRAMWAAQGEAAIRTVVDTARLTPGASVFGTIAATLSA